MIRRTLVTSRRGCFSATFFYLIPFPVVVLRSLGTINPGSFWRDGKVFVLFLNPIYCFHSLVASQQEHVQANESRQNFAQLATNRANYKKYELTILMLYILALAYFCFLPLIVSVN